MSIESYFISKISLSKYAFIISFNDKFKSLSTLLIQCWFLFIPAHSHIELRPIVWTIQLTLNLKYSKNAVFEFHHWFQNEDNCLSPQMKTKSQHYVPNWQLSAITFSCSRFRQLWGAQAEMSVQSESQCSISTSKFAFIVSLLFWRQFIWK